MGRMMTIAYRAYTPKALSPMLPTNVPDCDVLLCCSVQSILSICVLVASGRVHNMTGLYIKSNAKRQTTPVHLLRFAAFDADRNEDP